VKIFFYLTTILVLIFTISTSTVLAKADKSLPQEVELTLGSNIVIIDGESHQLEIFPFILDGTTLLPVRFVAQDVLGAIVDWDSAKKEISISREDQKINLWLNRNVASVNGEGFNLQQAPTLHNDRTLVPLRFLSENMGLNVRYETTTKKIFISQDKDNEIEVTPPIADFSLSNKEVYAGQPLEIRDNSVHPDGHAITAWLWEVESENGQTIVVDSIVGNILTKRPGKYTIRLKVKDQLGIWSDWYERELQVHPNQSPIINIFEANKTVVAQGELIEFEYDSHDEEWDLIEEERWVYRWYSSTGQLHEVIGKPKALFGERTYEVILKVRDSFNNWSEEASIEIDVTKEKVQSEFNFRFLDPHPGDIILNTDYDNYNLLPDADWIVKHGGPVLLLSNSPERVLYPGITYQDKIQGAARVYYYHKNLTGQNSLLKVWAENKGDKPVELIVSKSGLGGPINDEMHLGQKVSSNYLSSDEVTKLSIAPGQRIVLNGLQADKFIRPEELMSGMLDIEASGPIQITVAMVDTKYSNSTPLEILQPDGQHPRGTYENSNILIDVMPSGTQPEKILIGRGINEEYFLQGTDALTGEHVINRGNYGVMYNIRFQSEVTTGALINARGTRFKGSIKAFDDNVYLFPVMGVLGTSFFSAIIGVVPEGKEVSLVYTPPGGSDTPLVIGLIPKESW